MIEHKSSAARAWIKTIGHRLDELPSPWLLTAGSVLGTALGAGALLGVGGWIGQGLCLLTLGGALAAAWKAQPMLVGAPLPPVAKKQPPVEPAKPSEIKPEPEWPAPSPRLVVDLPGLLEMIELPGGTFRMGSPENDAQAYPDEKPQHPVTVSAFAIARDPVTRKLYREIVGRGPEAWQGDDRLPANALSWFDAVEFCNTLSRREGLRACYRIDGQQVTWDRTANGYRLPTEAEWEYAARAGTTTRWFFGDDDTDLDRYAWFSDNSGDQVHRVGEKEPNPWGLRDIIGNTYEWCWDWQGDYSVTPAIDPSGPPGGSLRVLRGGAFWPAPRLLRSAGRGGGGPEVRDAVLGFRCVRGPRRQPL